MHVEGEVKLRGKKIYAAVLRFSTNWAIKRRLTILLNPALIQSSASGKLTYVQDIDLPASDYTSTDRVWDAVHQIFIKRFAGADEAHGSGVLLRLNGVPFLLTAAHVTDAETEGQLMTCTSRYMFPIEGIQVRSNPPPAGNRSDDKLDLAYYALSAECDAALTEDDAVFLGPDDLDLGNRDPQNAYYLFAGFPWRRTTVSHGRVASSMSRLGGLALSASEAAKVGYSPADQVVVHFDRKHVAPIGGKTRTAPLLAGVSGGAIRRIPDLRIVGIATDHDPKSNLLIGTRMHHFLRCIKRKHGWPVVSPHAQPQPPVQAQQGQ